MKQSLILGSPRDCLSCIAKYKNKTVEHFGMILLDGANNVIKTKVCFIGGYTSSTVDVRVLLFEAIKNRAVRVIFFHNHPSGNSSPSEEDKKVTKNLVKAFDLCGMQALDHIIVGKYSYYSFLENKDI